MTQHRGVPAAAIGAGAALLLAGITAVSSHLPEPPEPTSAVAPFDWGDVAAPASPVDQVTPSNTVVVQHVDSGELTPVATLPEDPGVAHRWRAR